MHFDVSLGNPPFDGKTHHEFLRKAKVWGEYTCFVQPSDWVFEDKFQGLRSSIDKVKLINGNGPMDIGSFRPLSVSTFTPTNSKKVKVEDEINGKIYTENKDLINPFGDEKYWDVKSKLENHSFETIADYLGKTKGEYCIGIAKIRGNVNTDNDSFSEPITGSDFYSFLPNYSFNRLLKRGAVGHPFYFQDKIRAKNFVDYLKTDFARFTLATIKRDQNLNKKKFSKTPWLDWDESWSDERLFNRFGLNLEEAKFVQKVIDDFYD